MNDRRVDYTCCQADSYRRSRARLRPVHQISQLKSHDILRMQFTTSRFTRLSRFHVEPSRSRLGIEVENIFCEAAFQKVIMRCVTPINMAGNGKRSIEISDLRWHDRIKSGLTGTSGKLNNHFFTVFRSRRDFVGHQTKRNRFQALPTANRAP